jgi:cell division protein FtsB
VLELDFWSGLRLRIWSALRSGMTGVASAGRSIGSFAAQVRSGLSDWVSSSPLRRIRAHSTASSPAHALAPSALAIRRRLAAGANHLRNALAGVMHARSAESRRRRAVMGAAAGFALVVLVFSFPFTTLLSQHRQLTAADAQLATVRQENHQLLVQEKQLSSKTEIERRARQDYQLVEPGQTLFELLPGPGSQPGSSSGAAVGDPGDQPLVPPSRAPDLAPDPGLPVVLAPVSRGTARSGGHGTSAVPAPASSPPSSFWSRVGNTLEFWK